MVGRIGTYASSQMSLSQMMNLQQRMYQSELQINTGLKTQYYSGLGKDASRVLSFQNTTSRLETLISENQMVETKLEVANSSITALEKTMKDFSKMLLSLKQNETKDEKYIREIQDLAMKSLLQIQGVLTVDVDGQYMFGGATSNVKPVNFPFKDLESFQKYYDGVYNTYPGSRDADLQNITTRPADTGPLSFDPANGTITGANPGAFDNLAIGSQVTTGGGASTDAGTTYTVKAKSADGTQIRVSEFINSPTNPAPIQFFDKDGNTLPSGGNVQFQGNTIVLEPPVNVADWEKLAGSMVKISGSADVTDIDGVVKNNNGKFNIDSVTVDPATGNVILTTKGKTVPDVQQQLDPANPVWGGTWTPPADSTSTGTFTTNAWDPAAVNPPITVGGIINIPNAAGDMVSYKVTSIAPNGANWDITVQDATTTLGSTSWYKGDNMQVQHRIDEDNRIDVGLYASDPAIEKAIRALGLIAQGSFGTAGGLDQNMDRVNEAAKLVEDMLDSPRTLKGEEPGDIMTLTRKLGFTMYQVKETISMQKGYSASLLNGIDNMTKIDKAEAITNLQLDNLALNASYNAATMIRDMTLLNYIK